MTAPPTSGPTVPPEGWRPVFRTVVLVLIGVFSFFTAHGVLMTEEFLRAEIPAGTIQKIEPEKGGQRLQLTSGAVAFFPYGILFQQSAPITLKPGDTVAKQRFSLVYVLNGKELSNTRWVLRTWIISNGRLIILAIFLALHAAFVLTYRKTPWTDGKEARDRRLHRESRPVKQRSLAYQLILSPLKLWVFFSLAFTIILQLQMCCVVVVFSPFLKGH
jgi:hypothetical protein